MFKTRIIVMHSSFRRPLDVDNPMTCPKDMTKRAQPVQADFILLLDSPLLKMHRLAIDIKDAEINLDSEPEWIQPNGRLYPHAPTLEQLYELFSEENTQKSLFKGYRSNATEVLNCIEHYLSERLFFEFMESPAPMRRIWLLQQNAAPSFIANEETVRQAAAESPKIVQLGSRPEFKSCFQPRVNQPS